MVEKKENLIGANLLVKSFGTFFSEELKFSGEFVEVYNELIENDANYVKNLGGSNQEIAGYIAGVAHAANILTLEKKTQKEIADAVRSSESLLRKNYRSFRKRNLEKIKDIKARMLFENIDDV